MKLNQRLIPVRSLSLLTTLASPTAFAHTGHIVSESVHGLLHVEHIAALVAAGVIAFAVYTFRNR